MNRPQRQRLDQREQGRRRVGIATRSSALAGTALAAAFGLALAQHANATAKPPASANATVAPRPTAPTTTTPPSTTTAAPTTTTPPTTTTTVAPTTTAPPTTLRPPTQAPVRATGGGSTGSSGGS